MNIEQWLGLASLILGAGLGALTLRLLWVWSRYRPPYSAKCRGYLRNQRYSKEKRIAKQAVKDWVDYVYAYTVDGRTYLLKDGAHGKNENIPKTVTVIYQKKRPDRAYIKGMTVPHEPVWVMAAGILAVLFLVSGILLMI